MPRIIALVNPLYILIEGTASVFFIGAALAASRQFASDAMAALAKPAQ